MTKQMYEMVAEVIAGYPTHAPSLRTAQASFASSFAEKFAKDNPRFSRSIFFKACGINDPALHYVGDCEYPCKKDHVKPFPIS